MKKNIVIIITIIAIISLCVFFITTEKIYNVNDYFVFGVDESDNEIVISIGAVGSAVSLTNYNIEKKDGEFIVTVYGAFTIGEVKGIDIVINKEDETQIDKIFFRDKKEIIEFSIK